MNEPKRRIYLMPCPFCGSSSAPEINRAGEAGGCQECIDDLDGYFEVVCNAQRDGCGALTAGPADTPEKAIATWNRRA